MKRPTPTKLQRIGLAAAFTFAASAPALAQEPTTPAEPPPARTWKIVGGSLLGGGLALGTLGGVLFFRDTEMDRGQLWTRLALFAGGVGAAFTGGWMLAFPPPHAGAPRAALVVRTLRF